MTTIIWQFNKHGKIEINQRRERATEKQRERDTEGERERQEVITKKCITEAN